MTLIDGDKIVTVQLYDDEHEKFTEKKMSIIEIINAYTTEGVTVADDILGKIRAEIKQLQYQRIFGNVSSYSLLDTVVEIIDKYRKRGSGN